MLPQTHTCTQVNMHLLDLWYVQTCLKGFIIRINEVLTLTFPLCDPLFADEVGNPARALLGKEKNLHFVLS